jgi:membrane carboxypeptidase/penicillin-binding protein
MDALLVKIFATALTFSQVALSPEKLKTRFDSVADQQQVVGLLRAGCAQMRKAFDIEDVNIDDLIATAMDDAEAIASGHAAFKGINIKDLHTSYRQFCKNETIADSPVDVAEVIEFYNRTLTDLPDHKTLKGMRLPGASMVLDIKGQRFAEVFEPDNRRVWVPLRDIPVHVQRAFISAEDKRFYQHKGVDERSLIRAFIGNLAQSGRPQGGSTITQQVVKNILVGEDVTYERKIREMVLAARIEQTLTKAEILELYLNSTFLGRGSWGVEMAARSYFGKSSSELSVAEGALLAGITKGPNFFNPERHPDRAKQRYSYTLGRMQEDQVISADLSRSLATLPELITFERPRRNTGFHYIDFLSKEAKSIPTLESLTANSQTVRSTINPQLQRAAEVALQEGLARFEGDGGRSQFEAAEGNLGDAIRKLEAEQGPAGKSVALKPAWRRALENARFPLYDVHWPVAVVLDRGGQRGGGESLRVGLADGRILPLTARKGGSLRNLKLHDVVLVRVTEGNGKGKNSNLSAELRIRPQVQGAVVVLENKTGRILAMTGGFSYPLSQLNRVTQSVRQPGSALKPLTYLAALEKGLQPNTYVRDEEITLPPINGSLRERDYWSPKNYDGGTSGVITLRKALEHSKNLATVNLLDGGIDSTPQLSLDRVCALAVEAQIYKECARYYPFVLGAQPVRPIDLAAFFAAIANEGFRPTPYTIDSVERQGAVIYRHPPSLTQIGSADRASFYQLKTMMQGVLQRGTAHAISSMAPYVAGKTGTTDGENDAWFVGFSNDVTIAVWVGYDNADGKRRTLGSGSTGGSVAVPIFEPIMQAVWAYHAPKAPLSPPSVEARKLLVVARAGDGDDGTNSNSKGLVDYLRRDRNGKPVDARYALVGRDQAETTRLEGGYGQQGFQPWAPWDDRNRWAQPQRPASGGFFGLFGQRDDWQQQQYQQQQQQQQRQRQPQQQPQYQQPQYQQRRPSYPGYYQDRF